MKFHRAGAGSMEGADIVIAGVPDESKSHATRRGTSTAPDVLRAASNDSEFFVRAGKTIPTVPMRGTLAGKRVFDAGNVVRGDLYRHAEKMLSAGKVPVTIGGDHSITTDLLKAASRAFGKKLSLLYFDAHPDFVTSQRGYYGSVLADSAEFIDFKKSMLVGTRSAEPEEMENARKAGLKILTPIDIAELGVRRVEKTILARTAGSRTYVSIDLDCVDPAFAPGVSVPSPGGLAIADLLFLLTRVMGRCRIAGFDIVELSPDYDVNSMTANLAARILTECIASLKV